MSRFRAPALSTVLVLLLAVTAACGGDDGGSDVATDAGGDPEAFCERLQELDEADELDLDEVETFEAFDELVDLAPEEIDSDMERIQEAFEELTALEEEEGEDAFGAAFEIILDPLLTSSLEDFTEYAEDECGIEVEGADPLGDLSDGLSDDVTGDVSDDLSSDSSDDLTEDDLSPPPSLRAFLDENYPDYSDLASAIGSFTVNGDVQTTLTLDELVDAATAIAICEATLEFAEEVEITQIGIEVGGPDDTLLATGGFEDGCEAA